MILQVLKNWGCKPLPNWLTPPKFDSEFLKNDGWKLILSFWDAEFSRASRLNFQGVSMGVPEKTYKSWDDPPGNNPPEAKKKTGRRRCFLRLYSLKNYLRLVGAQEGGGWWMGNLGGNGGVFSCCSYFFLRSWESGLMQQKRKNAEEVGERKEITYCSKVCFFLQIRIYHMY